MLLLYAGYAIALLLLVLRVYSKSGGYRWPALAIMLLIFSSLFFGESAFVLASVPIFTLTMLNYGSRKGYLLILLSMVYLPLAAVVSGMLVTYMALLLFAALVASTDIFKSSKGALRYERHSELRRNTIQILLGVAFISLFHFLQPATSKLALIYSIFFGLLLGNYAILNKKSAISRALYGLERKRTTLGYGGIWLGLGALLAAALLSPKLAIVVFCAIFLADSFSTIVGVTIKSPKLFYNKGKSIAGSLAFFVVTAAASYPLIGIYALYIAFVAALVESLPLWIDDNLSVSITLTALFLILAAMGLAL